MRYPSNKKSNPYINFELLVFGTLYLLSKCWLKTTILKLILKVMYLTINKKKTSNQFFTYQRKNATEFNCHR